MIELTESESIEKYRKYFPVITSIIWLISIILFVGINLEHDLDNWETYKRWGAPSSIDIFNGSYWGLITTNFLHSEIWHIAFNLYWVLILGKKIEFETSKLFYGFLIVSSAIISSCSQIGFASNVGIGLSGIVYSFFGYLYYKSRIDPKYKGFLSKKDINLFLLWLVLCIILTQAEIWTVGNAAHIGGGIWGSFIAFSANYSKNKKWIMSSLLFLAIGSSFIWYPLNTSWLSYKAYQAHNNQKNNEAIYLYKKILERDSDNEFALENLQQLEIHQLSEKAFEFHENQKYNEAREIYLEILSLDEDNEWAKENLSLLPKD